MKRVPVNSNSIPPGRFPGASRGFTLIELTISAAIAAIVLVASYLCLSAGISTRKIIEPRTDALQTARVAMAMISADLRSACSLSQDFDFVGEQRALDEMEADNLDFATHFYAPTRPHEGDYCQVSYFVGKPAKSEHYSLWRRRNPALAPDPLSGGKMEEIARGLRGFRLEYYDGLDWYDSWGDAHPDKTKKNSTTTPPNLTGFPEAVRITLMLDLNPDKAPTAKSADEKPEPPLVFQTVVRLELADVPPPSSSPGGPANANTGTDSSQPNQPPANGGVN